MMNPSQHCLECGALWRDGIACEQHYHQMLAWEFDDPRSGIVHHLTVLCYNLQHPSIYSPEGLAGAVQLLTTFLEQGITPPEMRRNIQPKVDSGKRTTKITKRDIPAVYDSAPSWTLTIQDAIGATSDGHAERVTAWAHAVLTALKTAGVV
ncbi:MAG: hypothetical protein H7Y11_12000 [Armatimonadetes bacterium]|nr:hypothetical protein [Anaerolineae bacterium]